MTAGKRVSRESPWATVPEAAAYYRKSAKTFRRMLQNGFPHFRTGTGAVLVNLEEGDRYLLKDCAVEDRKEKTILREVLR